MAEISAERRRQLSEAGRRGAAARKTRSNGWIARRENALGIEDMRRRIKVGMLLSRLEDAAEGRVELTPVQAQAAKILLDKAMPTLQSVETTQIDPSATLGDADIRDQLRALLSAHPDVVAELIGEQARQARQSADPAPDHASHSAPSPISRAA